MNLEGEIILSIVVKEHNETIDKIVRIIEQASNLPIEKELIFVTSKPADEFLSILSTISSDRFNVDIRIIPDVRNSGEAVTLGALNSKYENVLTIDCHVCFPSEDTLLLLDTLERNPNALITPAIHHTDFPSCVISNNKIVDNLAVGYGAKIRISSKNSFEWVWLPKQKETEYPVPMACACAFIIKKATSDLLYSQGGLKQSFDFEEEKSMRLWRLGYPTLVEPRSLFGHWFKPVMSDTQLKNWYRVRTTALYCIIFNEDNWNKLNGILSKSWGNLWTDNLKYAKENYEWLRNLIIPYKDVINENYFIEIAE